MDSHSRTKQKSKRSLQASPAYLKQQQRRRKNGGGSKSGTTKKIHSKKTSRGSSSSSTASVPSSNPQGHGKRRAGHNSHITPVKGVHMRGKGVRSGSSSASKLRSKQGSQQKRRRRQKPAWDSDVNDLSVYKLTPNQLVGATACSLTCG